MTNTIWDNVSSSVNRSLIGDGRFNYLESKTINSSGGTWVLRASQEYDGGEN